MPKGMWLVGFPNDKMTLTSLGNTPGIIIEDDGSTEAKAIMQKAEEML